MKFVVRFLTVILFVSVSLLSLGIAEIIGVSVFNVIATLSLLIPLEATVGVATLMIVLNKKRG